MRKYLTLLIAVFLMWGNASAQMGSISGTIRDESGTLPSASIVIEGTQLGTISQPNGTFKLVSIPAGPQTVLISYVGYEPKKIEVEVRAGESTKMGAIKLAPASLQLDEILVQSTFRHGQQRAQAMERNTPSIVTIMAADAIGKLPDRNAAEAIQRMPGVQIERDQGEGRYVTVRGAPGPWSSTLINGSRIPDARGGSRDIALDVFPSEFIEYVSVAKTLTPDQEGDAIGGSVNFLTRIPSEDRKLAVTGSGGWNNNAKSGTYLGSLLYSDRSNDGNFGFVFSATVNSRDWGSDNYEVVYAGDSSVNELQLRDYLGNRTTQGLNFGAEWKVGENTKWHSNGMLTRFLDDELRRRNRYRFNNNRFELAFTSTKYRSNLMSGNVGVEHSWSDLFDTKVNVFANRSAYNYDSPSNLNDDQHGYYYVTFRQSGVDYQNLDSNGKKFIGNDSPDASYTGDHYENIQPHIGADTPIRAEDMIFQNAISSVYETTGLDYSSMVDNTYRLNNRSNIKFGLKGRWQKAEQVRRLYTWNYATQATMADFPRESFPENGGFLQEIDEVYDPLLLDYPTQESVDNAHSNAQFGPSLSVSDATNSSRATGNFDVTEKQYAGYLMGEFQLNDKVTVVPGARVEFTDATANGFAWLPAESVSIPTTNTGDYWAFLPMANVAIKANEKTDLRLAITRSFARGNFNDIAPFESVDTEDAEVSRGNPALKPTFAWNYDVLGSYYFDNFSAVRAGFFYKDIQDLISTASTTETLSYEGITQQYRITQPFNNESATLWGVELGYSQSLAMIPGFMSGFGFDVNYTYTKSETTLPGRLGESPTLANQSPHTFNAQVYYEKSGASFRLAANYRSPYIDDYTEDADGDRWRDRAFNMKLNASYAITPAARIFLEVTNLTNDPLRYYVGEGRDDRPEQVEYYSRRGNVGIHWSVF